MNSTRTPSTRTNLFRPRVFRRPAEIPPPTIPDLERLPSGQEVVLEVGCGVGWHPLRYAQNNGDKIVVAFERTRSKFSRFEKRLEKHPEIRNLIAVNADVCSVLPRFSGHLKLSTTFILYPNPYPKHKSQRWIHMPFLDVLRELTIPGGRIELATNISAYAQEVLDLAPLRNWRPIHFDRFSRLDRPGFQPRTHFEKKYFERGETLHHIALVPSEQEDAP